MKLFTNFFEDEGSGVIDFIGFGVFLQIPVLMFSTIALATQHEQFAVEAISRHGVRAHILVPDVANTAKVVQDLARDFGIKEDELTWSLNCKPDPRCLQPGTLVSLEVKLGGLSAQAVQGI